MSPLRLLLAIAAIVFIEQTLVMLWVLRSESTLSLEEAMLDSGFLIVLLTPALYWLQVRPLARQIEDRDAIAQELRRTMEQLETRIQERTVDLDQANRHLERSLAHLEQSRQEASL